MDDLVERLRFVAKGLDSQWDKGISDDMLEAAARITELEAHLATAKLDDVRLGIEAAADEALTWFPEATTGKYLAGGVVASIRNLEPATIIARAD